MLTSLLIEARIWPILWRRRFVDFWRFTARENLAFLLMLGMLVLGVVGIICFAYVDGTRIQPARLEAIKVEAGRERRRADDLQCLAENIYFEARGEPLDGQYAVAEVTLNRTHAPNFPHTICQVVHEKRWDPGRRRFVADFSWTESSSLSPEEGPAWRQAMSVAGAAYDDVREPLVPDALFYHATSIRPAWARTRKAVATIGNHIFYR